MALRELEEGIRQLQLRAGEQAALIALLQLLCPIGTIEAYAGSAAPAGYLLCQGQTLQRSAYPELFAAIGTTYGAPSGTTFSVPDGRGRALIGAGTGSAAGATAHPLGQLGGAETHTLTEAQMPAHDHDFFGQTVTWGSGNIGFSTQPQAYAGAPSGNGLGTFQDSDGWAWTLDRGGSQAHNNMQPYLAVNFIIRAK